MQPPFSLPEARRFLRFSSIAIFSNVPLEFCAAKKEIKMDDSGL